MKNIYVIGEVLVDLIDIEHQGLIEATLFEKKFGGASANVAISASRLGANVNFLGCIGTDYFGEYLKDTLEDNNVNLQYGQFSGNTTIAWVGLDKSGERYFTFNRGSDGDYVVKDLNIKESIVHFGSATALLGGELKRSYFTLLENSLENNNIISFDPNFRDKLVDDVDQFIDDSIFFIKNANFVKLSIEELELITNTSISCQADIEKEVLKLKEISSATFFITLGPKGTLVFDNGEVYVVDTIKINQVDSTGAGDAFVGAFLSRIAKDEYNLKESVFFANKVGALVCTKHGAIEALPYENEVADFE